MKTKFYIIVLVMVASVTIFNTSCNYIKPVKGNGNIVKVDKELTGSFSSVEIGGSFNVILTQDSLPKLSIETDENLMKYIDIMIKKEKLIIESKKLLISTRDINIYLTVGQLKEMKLTGAVVMRSASKINLDAIKMNLSGASNVYMDMNCTALNSDLSGSSTMKLIGTAIDAEIETSGASEIDNSQMVVENMKLKVSGAGSVKVNVLTKLDVKVSGAAEVKYMGTPEVHKEISGAGSVNKIF